MKEEVTTGTMEMLMIKTITNSYWKHWITLEEMDTFLKTYNLQRLNHDEKENLNRLITSKETELVIINLPINKSPGPESHW